MILHHTNLHHHDYQKSLKEIHCVGLAGPVRIRIDAFLHLYKLQLNESMNDVRRHVGALCGSTHGSIVFLQLGGTCSTADHGVGKDSPFV
jgi:hypothetical protein